MSFSNYKFDFGVAGDRGSSSSRPLRDQKPSPSPSPSQASSSSSPSPNSFSPSLQQNNRKPSWSHQPAAPSSRSGSAPSMAGDIFGRSWSSSSPSGGTVTGIPNKNPNLFSDLLTGSALGGPTGKAPPSSLKSSSSSSKVNSGPPPPPSRLSEDHLVRGFSSTSIHGVGVGVGGSTGHHYPMKPTSGPPSVNSKSKGDPFGSLVNLGSKKSASMAASDSRNNGSKASSSPAFAAAAASSSIPTKKDEFDFGIPLAQNQSVPRPPTQPVQASKSAAAAADPLEMFFSSSSAPPPRPLDNNSASEMMFSKESEDWNVGEEDSGAATDLDGLPPPPFGINASAAKNKGSDYYKNGQYADAIKWLSWAVSLLENKSNGNAAATMNEVLSCRASCFKEVGEYKKAIADCSKVLELDGKNVSVLLQRALLYESSEKYRLGAEDLRMVLKIDPGNRLARSTIHRLNKFSD